METSENVLNLIAGAIGGDNIFKIASSNFENSDNLKIAESVKEELRQFSIFTIQVHRQLIEILNQDAVRINRPYMQEGEKPNPLFQAALNNSIKILLAALKVQELEEDEKEKHSKTLLIDGLDMDRV